MASAEDIGRSFVNQYYDVHRKQPVSGNLSFYNEGSCVVRVDTDSKKETATTLTSIDDLLQSFNGPVEIEAIDCADSLYGGVIVQLSGSVETKRVVSEGVSVDVRKKFTQTLALAFQGKRYFIASDIVRYLGDDEVMVKPNVVDAKAEAKESAPLDKEPETLVEVSSAVGQSDEKSLPAVEKPEPSKMSYASKVLLAAPKKNPTVPIQPAVKPSRPAVQKQMEGESKSVYVKNLPPGISQNGVFEQLKRYGRIKKDGVFVKTDPKTGFCFGFVDFMDVESARNAVNASPLTPPDGRKVYVEFKRASSGSGSGSGPSRGGRGNTHGRQH